LNVVIGGIVMATPDVFGDSNGDFLHRFFTAMLIAATLGTAIGFAKGRGLFRFISVSMLGAATVVGGLLLLFAFAISVGGGCLD
jgi:hypothetical protein